MLVHWKVRYLLNILIANSSAWTLVQAVLISSALNELTRTLICLGIAFLLFRLNPNIQGQIFSSYCHSPMASLCRSNGVADVARKMPGLQRAVFTVARLADRIWLGVFSVFLVYWSYI